MIISVAYYMYVLQVSTTSWILQARDIVPQRCYTTGLCCIIIGAVSMTYDDKSSMLLCYITAISAKQSANCVYSRQTWLCSDVYFLRQAGFDPTSTRFGLHSHGQYVDLKQQVVYNTDPASELIATSGGITCNLPGVIPDYILNLKASDLLDIMGFSCYPPRPSDISDASAQLASFDQLSNTLGLMNQVAQRYGTFSSGPYAGQYVKQGLVVEYGTQFHYPDEVAYQQQHTELFFKTTQAFPWWMGAIWYEPTYTYAIWNGGEMSLYYKFSTNGTNTSEAPTATLSTWGSFARSPSSTG